MQLELLHLYPSPWSERARWGLDAKGLRYALRDYAIGAGEEELRRRTGQAQVPVLFVDGEPIADSTAILDFAEERCPSPPLVPDDPTERARLGLLEELAVEVLGPQGRLLVFSRMFGDAEPAGDAALLPRKYCYTAHAGRRARASVRRVLAGLGEALGRRKYLVGDRFTRADLTVAALLGVASPPPDELFLLPGPMRAVFEDPLAREPEFAPLFAWRDRIYREHRGGPVRPA